MVGASKPITAGDVQGRAGRGPERASVPITAGDEAPGPGPAGGDEVRRVPASRPKNPCSKGGEREERTARALRAGVGACGWGRGGMREGMEGLINFGCGAIQTNRHAICILVES